MAATTYPVGSVVRVFGTFQALQPDGVTYLNANPTTLTLRVTDPTRVTTAYSSPTNDSTGKYHQDITVSAAGYWFYRWIATGAVQATSLDGTFYVEQTQAP